MRIAHVIIEHSPSVGAQARRAVVGDLCEALRHLGHSSSIVDDEELPRFTVDPDPDGMSTNHELVITDALTDFDLVHVHAARPTWGVSHRGLVPTVTTLRCPMGPTSPILHALSKLPSVATSTSQPTHAPMLDWHAVIPDGRSSSDVSFSPKPGKYLACAGPIRRIDRALSIAAEAKLPLKLASNGANRRLLGLLEELCVACRHVEVEIVESHSEWLYYVENAQALLVTGPGVEALGPLVAESVAAGTPVVGFSDSEVAALLKPGHSGFIVDSTADALEVLRDLTVVDRHQCRFDYLRRFTADAMAQAYLSVYTRLVEQPIVQAS